MNKSYEMRIQQRIKIAKFGKFFIKAALFLGILGFMCIVFLPAVSRFGLAMVGFSAIIAPFGAIFEVLFCKIGWSDNFLIDVFFNQASIIAAIIGLLASLFYIGFFVIYGMNYPFLLIIGILLLALSVILLTLGLRFS